MDRPTPAPSMGDDLVDLGELSRGTDSGEVVGNDPRPPVSRRTVVLVAAALVAVTAVALIRGGSAPAKKQSATVAPGPTAATGLGTGQLLADIPQGDPPQVTRVGPHLLGVSARWDLFGWGTTQVVRLEPAAGRLTVTTTPPVQSTGPVSVAVSADRVIVRPLDDVPGYAVVDGRPVAGLKGMLAGGGVMLPGPTPGEVWREDDSWFPSVMLVGLNGVATGARAALPPAADGQLLLPDGSGYVLAVGSTGAYDLRPSSVHRLTTGSIVAVGAGRALAVECSGTNRCSAIVMGIDGRDRRVIGTTYTPQSYVGPISPDGRRAAIVVQANGDRARLELVDLRTGAVTMVGQDVGLPSPSAALAWSPDGTLLFALDPQGRVHVVNPATGSATVLPVTLPPLSQIAVRPAPA